MFSNLKPVGINTDLVIPGSLGKPVAKIRSGLNGMPSLHWQGTSSGSHLMPRQHSSQKLSARAGPQESSVGSIPTAEFSPPAPSTIVSGVWQTVN